MYMHVLCEARDADSYYTDSIFDKLCERRCMCVPMLNQDYVYISETFGTSFMKIACAFIHLNAIQFTVVE